MVCCEEEPDIMDEIKPIPVVYAIFDKYEPVNYIYLTKTFSGDPYGADYNAQIEDSICFENAAISVIVSETIDVFARGQGSFSDIYMVRFLHIYTEPKYL